MFPAPLEATWHKDLSLVSIMSEDNPVPFVMPE